MFIVLRNLRSSDNPRPILKPTPMITKHTTNRNTATSSISKTIYHRNTHTSSISRARQSHKQQPKAIEPQTQTQQHFPWQFSALPIPPVTSPKPDAYPGLLLSEPIGPPNLSLSLYIYIYMCIYMYRYRRIYRCMHVCMYIYIHIFTHLFILNCIDR